MSIPSSFLDQIRDRITLSALVQRTGTPLKRKGSEWQACCPFHDEKSPSFFVNDAKQFYHCFGCGAHGDAIGWMMHQRGMTFIDAVKDLAEEAGLEVPEPDPRAAQRAKRKESAVEIMKRAEVAFREELYRNYDAAIEARDYLADRGIAPSAVEKFGIGYAPAAGIGETSAPMRRLADVPSADMIEVGLLKASDRGGEPYPFFRGRVMIPIHDARGGTIGFGGRALGDAKPKYLNSPDTPLFDKGRTLFNLHRAAASARAKNRLLIVEGYMDAIAVDTAGMDNVVANNGTALTEHQLNVAWRLVDSPLLAFDGDAAGRRAANRAAYKALPLLQVGKTLRFVEFPEGQDADDVARSGGLAALNAAMETSLRLVDVIWRDVTARHRLADPDGRSAAGRELSDAAQSIKDPDVRRSYHRTFMTLLEGRQATQRAPAATGRGGVSQRVETALVLGLAFHPNVATRLATGSHGLQWRDGACSTVFRAIMDAALDATIQGGALVFQDTLRAIEAAGATQTFADMRRLPLLAMPFPTTERGARADAALTAALADHFNKEN